MVMEEKLQVHIGSRNAGQKVTSPNTQKIVKYINNRLTVAPKVHLRKICSR